jgi:two-component system, LytTR family, sensor kinase
MHTAMKRFGRELALVFALWTLVALSTGLADYVFQRSIGRMPAAWDVFKRPLLEQWIWAALTPLVFKLAQLVPLQRPHLPKALALHSGFFVMLSLLHCLIADAIDAPMLPIPKDYEGSLLKLRFLQEFYSDIWMYWPLVCIRALIDAHARERDAERQAGRLKHLLADARLSALRAQIQPHFLFNTLHAVTALLRVDARAAEDMLADLATMLRASFDNAAAQESTLQRELELVHCYLRIEQRRLGDRLRVRERIAPQVQQAMLPVLMLQSLVENAVAHGIAPTGRIGTLDISVQRDGDHLQLVVRDDGAGLTLPHQEGVGLANTRERLRRLYGDAQSFEVSSTPGRGTCVSLRLPYREYGEDSAAPNRGLLRSAAASDSDVPQTLEEALAHADPNLDRR